MFLKSPILRSSLKALFLLLLLSIVLPKFEAIYLFLDDISPILILLIITLAFFMTPFIIREYDKIHLFALKRKLQDISYERTRNQDQLRSELFVSLVDDAPIFVCQFLPDGTITFVNKSFAHYFYHKESELIGKNIFSVVNELGGSSDAFQERISQLSSTSPVKQFYRSEINPDGPSIYWIDRAIFDDHNRIVLYQSIGVDVTKPTLATQALLKNSRNQSVISDTISQISGASFDQLSVAMQDGLSTIGSHFGAGRIGLYLRKGSHFVLYNYWYKRNRETLNDRLEDVDSSWIVQRMKLFQPIYFPNIQELSDGEFKNIEQVTHKKTKTTLILPVSFNHTLVGFLYLDSCEEAQWDKSQIELLNILTKVIGNMFRANFRITDEGPEIEKYTYY